MSITHTRTSPVLGLAVLLVGAGACHDATGPSAEDLDLLDRLSALDGVAAVEIDPPGGGYARAFRIDITQPVDHENPAGPTFTQRAYLAHRDEGQPLVFGPSGYGASRSSGSGLTGILDANRLFVVHRYFPDAAPEPLDWQYLNVRQAAADHHRIVQLFRPIYPGPWVSTGRSKGGMTALYHRRLYPEDVDATVAYAAPFALALEDQRYIPFLASVGTSEGREIIHAFQRRLLEHRDSLIWRFEEWFPQNGMTLSISATQLFEAKVVVYEWAFWQRHVYDYDDIPGPEVDYDAWIDHLADVVNLGFDSDDGRAYYGIYHYQANTELGRPAFATDHLEDLLLEEPLTPQQRFGFPDDLVYSSSLMEDILAWLRTDGDQILYIYGGVDPWTAGAVELSGEVDALKIAQPGEDHGVLLSDLDERELALSTLGGWLGLELGLSADAFAESYERAEGLVVR